MKQEIINYIKKNRVSTTEVADCLDKSGIIDNRIVPIVQGYFRVGEVKYVYGWDMSNYPLHEQIRTIAPNLIVFAELFGNTERAFFGSLVAKYLFLYQEAQAIVTNAKVRDAPELLRERYAIWCTGFTPIGCFNKGRPGLDTLDEALAASRREKYDGAIAVCDDCGAVIIPKELHTRAFLQKLVDIEEQEDTWFDRLDNRKDNTFDIVCLKTYLNDK
jgi:regulator of RNase E activity RraA